MSFIWSYDNIHSVLYSSSYTFVTNCSTSMCTILILFQSPHCVHMRAGMKFGDASLKDSMLTDGLWDVFNNYHMGCTGMFYDSCTEYRWSSAIIWLAVYLTEIKNTASFLHFGKGAHWIVACSNIWGSNTKVSRTECCPY